MPVGIQLRRGLVLVPPLFDTLRKKKTIFIFFLFIFLVVPVWESSAAPTHAKAGSNCLFLHRFGRRHTGVRPHLLNLFNHRQTPRHEGEKKSCVCVCCVRVCRSSLVVLRHGYTEKCVNRRRAVIYSSASIMETCTLATTTWPDHLSFTRRTRALLRARYRCFFPFLFPFFFFPG